MRAALALLALLIATSPAAAQVQNHCPNGQTYDELAQFLENKYHEQLNAKAVLASGRARIEFWSNRHTGTWTALGVTPNNCAWSMSSGEGWQTVEVTPGENGA